MVEDQGSVKEAFNLVQSLCSSDNGTRNAAEAQYMSVKGDVSLAGCLLSIISQTNSESIEDAVKQVRQLCVVLLRQVLLDESDHNVYLRMPNDEMRTSFRAKLLLCMSQEQEHHVRSSLCEIIGNMCAYIIESNEWPEIIPFIFEYVQSSNSIKLEIGVFLLGLIAPTHLELFMQPSHIGPIIATLGTCLINYSHEAYLMHAAMKTFSVLVLLIPRQSEQDILLPLLEPCMRGLQLVCKKNDEDRATGYIEVLIDMAEESCAFFTSHLLAVFEVVMDLVESGEVLSVVVHQLVEFLVTLCENGPKFCRKIKSAVVSEKNYFSSRLLPFCAQLMCRIGDDSKWDSDDTVESIEDEEDFSVGEQSFDRVTHALGVRSTFTIVLNLLKNLLANNNDSWKNRYSGLCVIANYLDVSSRIPDSAQLQQHRADVCATLIAYTNDPMPRVRSAAFFGLAKFAHTFSDEMLEEQVNHIIQTLLTSLVLSTNPSPRVRRSILLALTALLHVTSSQRMERWAGLLLGQVTTTLEDGPVIVQEQCVAVIYSLAESTNNSMLAKYYDSLMPVLKRLLAYAEKTQLEHLWGTTLECCAMVGEASGKSKFYNDAIAMMDTLVVLHANAESSSNMNRFLLKSWVRIARCMGNDFVPYLRPVLQKILEAVEQNVYEAQGGSEDEALQDMEVRSDVDVVEGAAGWVAIRTVAIEEQACACQLVTMLVERMQEDFFPYVEQTVRALAPLLQSPHEDIRCHVALAMPELVRSAAKVEKMPAVSVLSSYVVSLLIELVQEEDVYEILTAGLKAINLVIVYATTNWAMHASEMNCINVRQDAFTHVLEVHQLKSLSQCTQIVLRDSMQRRAVLRAEAAVSGGADDGDQDDERKLRDENSGIYSHLTDLLGTMLRSHSALFAPIYVECWVEMVDGMLHKHCLLEDQLFAIGITDFFLEFGFSEGASGLSSHLSSFLNSYVPRLSECCRSSTSPLMRQASAFSFATIAERYPAEFSSHASESIRILGISDNSSALHEHDFATEGSMFAYGTILETVESSGVLSNVDCNAAWGKWLSYLPLQCDRNIGMKVIRQLLRLLQEQPFRKSLLVHETQHRTAEAISVLLTVVFTDSIDTDLSNEIQEYLLRSHGSQSGISSAQLNSLCAHLRNQALEAKLFQTLQTSISHEQADALSSSPGMTAPIHSVLLNQNF